MSERPWLGVYRAVCRLLPRGFRDRYGAEMEDLFRDALRELGGRAGFAGRLWALCRGAADVIGHATRIRLTRARGRRSRTAPWGPEMSGPEMQDGPIVDALVQDLRYAARWLRRNPGFTAVATLTLGLGIGANTTIFSVVNGVLLRPLPYESPDRLAIVWHDFGDNAQSLPAISPLDYRDYREMSETFEDFAAGMGREVILSGEREPEMADVAPVTANFFPLLGVEPALGRTFTAEEDVPNGPHVVVLSHRLWQRRYGGDPGIVGRAIEIGGTPYEVVGVLPEGFRLLLPPEAFLIRDADLWVPFQYDYAEAPPRNFTFFTAFGRLADDASFEEAQAEMDRIAATLRQDHAIHRESNLRVRVVPLHHDIVKNVRPGLLLLLGAVGFVLLIACVNVAHLVLVRGRSRERELAVRAAIGASRGALIRGILTESLLLAVLGGLLGLALTHGGLELLAALRPANLPRLAAVEIDAAVLGFVTVVCLATTLLFGLIPAFQNSKTDVGATLKEGGRTGAAARQDRMRGLLVVGELALSIVLLVGVGLMVRSFNALQDVRPGFDPGEVLTFRLRLPGGDYPTPDDRRHFYRTLQDRLAELPGVETVGAVSKLPLTGSGPLQPFAYDEETARNWESVTADEKSVLPGYFEAVGTRLISGRLFTRDDGTDPRVIIIDETLAGMAFPDEDPIGQRLQVERTGSPDPYARVVGVVEHQRIHDLTRPVRPQIYQPYAQASWTSLAFTVRAGGDASNLAGLVRRQVAELDPGLPVTELRPMTAYVSRATGQARFSLILMAIFGGLALILTAVGIYGVISYSVSQRTQEIGIRMALGASPGAVRGAVVRDGLKLVAAALAIGLAAALGLSNALSGLFFQVHPADPATFAGVTAALTAVALVACYLPARRATRIDPLDCLRAE